MKYLTEADTETVLAQYMTYCADEAALEALESAVRVRATLEETLAKQLEEAVRIIEANKPAIDAMVDALMEKNHSKDKSFSVP